jgi:L-ascorbate metabolism protein UlaG (beta-lactamase superfamily)
MSPEEAVQAHLDLDATRSVGMHYGTFPLTIEGFDEPQRALAVACRDRQIPAGRFTTLPHGASIRL